VSAGALSRLVWAICAVCLLLQALSLVLILWGQPTPLPGEWMSWRDQAIGIFGFLGAPVLGGLIAARRPGNAYGWVWLGFALGFSFSSLATAYAAYALVAEPGSLPAPRTVGTAVSAVGWIISISLVPFLLLLFPTGRLSSRRWRFVAWPVAVAGALVLVAGPLIPGRSGFAPLVNPLGVEGTVGVAITIVGFGGVVFVLLAVVPSAFSLVFRYRRAVGVERQQIKWFAFAAALMGSLIAADLLGLDDLLGDALWNLLGTASFMGLYVAVGVAILRYRLYDIDVVINRTLVYGLLTATLALTYLGSVVSLQRLLSPLVGDSSQLAVVASTLGIAALFSPLRRRIQVTIDRRFYRRKYDAKRTLEAFSAKLRDETDLESLRLEVLAVVQDTVQPEKASLWLKNPSGNGSRNGPGAGKR
jgi:hypothetical protein